MNAFDSNIPEWRGIRTDRYTYARSRNGPLFLYDSVSDPYELNNLVNNESARDLLEHMDKMTDKMAQKIGDPFEPWSVIGPRMIQKQKEWLVQNSDLLGFQNTRKPMVI